MSVLANLNDIEREAQARLPGPTFDYFAGGADDEITLARNRSAWSELVLRPPDIGDVCALVAE